MVSTGSAAEAVAAWYRHRHPELGDVSVSVDEPPAAAGHSNELLFLTVRGGDGERSVVVRSPPDEPRLFPTYDLTLQVAVQEAAAAAGVPVAPAELELDESWLGHPFLVMPRVDGRHTGDAPGLCDWLLASTADQQRSVHVAFLDTLARIHRVPWEGTPLEGMLRGAGGGVDAELDWWHAFADWAFGDDARAIHELLRWCRTHRPHRQPPAVVLWGDVRLGNVVFDDAGRPAAVLDWEMASLGPAESDLAWLTALTDLTVRFAGAGVPGFLDRDAVIAHHETNLGRPMLDMAWHEAFALTRAAALGLRTEVVSALRRDRSLPRAATHFLVTHTAEVMAQF